MDLLKRFLGKGSPQPKSKASLFKPPIVMRISKKGECDGETVGDFISTGWRYNESNEYTQAWDRMLRNAASLLPEGRCRSIELALPNGLRLKAGSIISPEIDALNLPTTFILYISGAVSFEKMPTIDKVVGGPARELLDTLQYIALRMEARISAIMTDPDRGDVLVVYKSWALNYTIYNNKERWTNVSDADTTIKKESDTDDR